jgi:D-erythro-7,8-dihydroneopterin triphosphate epimerase
MMSKMDKIYIRNLKQNILIGINPEEKITKQPVLVSIEILADCSVAGKSDFIDDALDYSVIHDEVVDHMQSTHYDLIETLAENIASLCLDHEKAQSCKVTIDKPEALAFASSVAIEILRSR